VQAFSIVTVCFNDAEALVPTIRSIVEQKLSDFQYVIQDGGSSDDTAAVVKSFGDWIEVFSSEPDAGIYQAMNRAVRRCTGRYTLFMNAADVLASPTVLSEVEAQLVDGDDIVTGQSIAVETGKPHPFRAADRFWTGMTFDHQAAFVRTDLLKQFPYDESLRISGDFDFFSRMRLRGASFRSIETTICRKPYAVGASASFIARFRERYGIAMRHFGEQYPVQQTLQAELVQYMVKYFDANHLKAEMEAMPVEGLLAMHDELDALTAARHGRV
jgi:glycosyltransferase involved in cell wall biosynthesis